ncbi:MAG TPA: hypothetical protein VE934_12090 [Polaromonas sp.]|uniref:hypothetical protein n=1 Tax=Polaromonas sp. TaxID=1869339 RepID=UPI002D4668A8|nr:hypothetical protein [Polaromonas sp.]HYW57696.1 hypothetical protein [Polaromonas sp.]
MHPQELHLAVLGAVESMETVDGEGTRAGPTLRDIACKLPRMSDRELINTLKNLNRRGNLYILRKVRVAGCCKPVAQYAVAQGDAPRSMEAWRKAMASWMALT